MRRWIKRTAALLAGLSGLALFAAWLVLSSSMLAKTRGDLTARVLSRELGQTVEVTGGVRVDLGMVLHVAAQGVALPSQTMTDVSLARIEKLEFDVALADLVKGRIDLHDIQLAGASVNLVVDANATSSWATTKPARGTESESSDTVSSQAAPSAGGKGNDTTLVGFLAGHRIRFSDSGVIYKDARNGLDLNLLLSSLDLSRDDLSAPVVLKGAGTLNGQDLSLNATFPPAQPFTAAADFSQISIKLDGTPEQGGYDAGFSTAITIGIAELGQLLDVLKLEKSVSGTGQVSAVLKTSPGSASVQDLEVLFTLDGGQSLEVTGDLGKLDDPSDVSLDTSLRLYSKANQPAPTKERRNLKLIGVDMQLIAQPDGIPHRGMVIETNGFVLDTSGVGPPPISVSEISRTPEGHLRLGKLVLRIGPPEAHYLVLEGAVSDVLRLEGVDFAGKLAIPLAGLVAAGLPRTSDALGQVSGGFHLSGNLDELGLSDLNAVSQGTDLWNLNVSGSVRNALTFSDIALDIAADVPSGAKLLAALGLEPVETGPVKLTTKLTSHGTEWMSDATVAIAESQLDIGVDLDLDDPNPMVRGQVESDLIKVDHLRDVVVAAMQLGKLGDAGDTTEETTEKTAGQPDAPADTPPASEDGIVTEPLVLKKPGQGDLAGSEMSDAGASDPSGPMRNVTLRPLGQAILLSGMDLSVTIDLRKIEGVKGTSSLTSDVEMKDNKARFGPMKFEYDGAHFDVSGSMDLNEDPDTVKLSGSAGGWNFGEIMQELRFKKGASGILNANFDVSGHHASVRDFLGTMQGGATVSMRNGSIDSQLLDLAGLGVIPWLFSKDRGSAANIVCMRAPLHISQGRISTKQAVVETDQVQIVVFGAVDLKHKTLDISGQPRRIGKPLSRSPWPFTAVGPVAKPKIKVKDGPRRLRRSDGASTMPDRRKLCVPDILQLK